jgi:pyridoxal phosphate enzyme (YggS family)
MSEIVPDRLRDEIAGKLNSVRSRMAEAAFRAGRAPSDVTLVAVSKTHPFAVVRAAYDAGQRDFGENRIEELAPKAYEGRVGGMDDLRWHLIGTVQSRKTNQVVGPLTLIHAIDRVKIAERISQAAVKAGLVMDVLLEVNVSGEATKHGFAPEELLACAGELLQLGGIRVHGLMTMAPLVEDPEDTRPTFRGLRELRDRLAERFPQGDWSQLSMGMTNDFEVAIEEGATLVRVGSAIFGSRQG